VKKEKNRMKLFFVTDVHGSELCFRKFISAVKIYGVDAAVLLRDLSGKMVVPIIKREDGKYECKFLGEYFLLENDNKLNEMINRISSIGFYHYITNMEEYERISKDKETINKIFFEEMVKRLKHWMELADEKLKDVKIPIFMAPGNDDPFDIDKVINDSKTIVNCDMKKVMIDEYEMITMSYSNPTPWETPRELPEEELEKKIESLVSQITDMSRAIFNFHVPPYGSVLDLAPLLDDKMRQSAGTTVHVGSHAVAKAIEKYQPLLGMHGHIHESRGIQKIGKTFICNPGSEYGEGILKGIIIDLKGAKIKGYQFTSG
jgi:Icc-related predicted phosphoesterase